MAIRVLLADDHQIFRDGIRTILEREGFQVVGEASDGHQAIGLAKDLHPDLGIIDFSMPRLNGIDAAREILKEEPKTQMILLTMYTEDQYVLKAISAGIRGYVVKTQAADDLIQAIRKIMRGAIYLSPGVSQDLLMTHLGRPGIPTDPLSARERQVLQLVAEGNSTKGIARLLDISFKTAEAHRTRIMQKLDIHETASLVRYAIRSGLVQP